MWRSPYVAILDPFAAVRQLVSSLARSAWRGGTTLRHAPVSTRYCALLSLSCTISRALTFIAAIDALLISSRLVRFPASFFPRTRFLTFHRILPELTVVPTEGSSVVMITRSGAACVVGMWSGWTDGVVSPVCVGVICASGYTPSSKIRLEFLWIGFI